MKTGVRTMEGGMVSAGRKANGENYFPKLELVRFTIPCRVYTQVYMDVIAESAAKVHESRNTIKGMKMIYEPKYLRSFQAKFEKLWLLQLFYYKKAGFKFREPTFFI